MSDGQTIRKTSDQPIYEFFVTCSRGFEPLLADELRALSATRLRPLSSGVTFFGTLEMAYRACLWLRLASRVLLVLDRITATDSDTLYMGISSLDWESHLAPGASLAVNARGTNEQLRNTQFVAQRVKDAVVDRMRSVTGSRPDVSRQRADVNIDINLHDQRATVSIDLSGEPLHRRGYRVQSSAIGAPVRENLAAAMLLAGGWHKSLGSEDAFMLDPMCGSGTIAIEAAMIAADAAPGLLRDYWGFTGWHQHDDEIWASLLDEADARLEAGLERLGALPILPVVAGDIDPAAIRVARESARRAGVEKLIDFHVSDVAQLRLESGYQESFGLMVTNPPYGLRMASTAQLPALYTALSTMLSAHPMIGGAVVITADSLIEAYLNRCLGITPTRTYKTMNGPIETVIRVWQRSSSEHAGAGEASGAGAGEGACEAAGGSIESIGDAVGEAAVATAGSTTVATSGKSSTAVNRQTRALTSIDATEFANRLIKMAKHRARWARRSSVDNYRVYDADLPDFNVAIDIYQGAEGTRDAGSRWLSIAEYRAPSDIDPALSDARLAEVLRIAPEVLGVLTSNVFLKRRERASGGSQYSDQVIPADSALHLISEAGLTFEIDLASRLDTGIFLDHRITRSMLREKAAGLDCLNLFAYTGTASVYMAAGQAKSVTTVDLSNTYLKWARRNMNVNGYGDKPAPELFFEQADVLRWVAEKRALRFDQKQPQSPNRFGLIFVDVPTFSNSSRMGRRTWDVQRDHVELLIDVSRLLTADGEAVFSTNLRGFKPDLAALAKARVRLVDITASTIPPDFERTPNIHHCYLLTRDT